MLQGKPHHPSHRNVPIQEDPAVSTLSQHHRLRSQSPQPTRYQESVQEVLRHPESSGYMPDRNSCLPTPVATASLRRARRCLEAEHVADIDETPKPYRVWSLRTPLPGPLFAPQSWTEIQRASAKQLRTTCRRLHYFTNSISLSPISRQLGIKTKVSRIREAPCTPTSKTKLGSEFRDWSNRNHAEDTLEPLLSSVPGNLTEPDPGWKGTQLLRY